MTNITKELVKDKKEQEKIFSESEAVKQVLLLESGDAQLDRLIARGLGNNHSIALAETAMGQKLELEKLDGMYAGNVFTIEQIKTLARKYDLRFLAAPFFTGKMDVQVISKIKEFHKMTGAAIDAETLGRNFLILAPENCFALEPAKMIVTKKLPDPDPAIFYRIDNTHFRLVHQWGHDFNILQRLQGLKWQNDVSRFIFQALTSALLIAAAVTGLSYFLNIDPLYYLTCIGGIAYAGLSFTDEEDGIGKFKYHNAKWMSTTKVVAGKEVQFVR